MKNYFPLDLGRILDLVPLTSFNSVGTPYKRPMSHWKKKEKEKCLLALKPEQGPRGIWRKSLKPGALHLDLLGATDLNAHYKGE